MAQAKEVTIPITSQLNFASIFFKDCKDSIFAIVLQVLKYRIVKIAKLAFQAVALHQIFRNEA